MCTHSLFIRSLFLSNIYILGFVFKWLVRLGFTMHFKGPHPYSLSPVIWKEKKKVPLAWHRSINLMTYITAYLSADTYPPNLLSKPS